ncbi:MAG: AAA family ATPase [Euryarchaeota archaeon]|nr:AAA family ATPase [Euryarchaeota archaeon]MDE2045394.1 AAA family ATPase [Thermoplasmata archaeon]
MNPYDPQHPTPPDQFAGRALLIQRTREALDAASRYRRGTAILVHGHRGSGKTSALKKIRSLSEGALPGSIVVEVPLQESLSGDRLLEAVAEEARSFVRRKKLEGSRWHKVWDRLTRVQVSVLGTSVSVGKAPAGSPTNPLTLLRETLSALAGVPLLLVTIDDAERLSPDAVRTLKSIVEEDSPVPILLAVGAGPELLHRLASHDYSPVARIFSGAVFDMESFSAGETREALETPLKGRRGADPWTAESIQRIHELSHGYPYLVKCLAYAAWQEGRALRAPDVDAAVPNALSVGAAWFERELQNASDGDVAAFVRLARSGKTTFRTKDILELGVNYAYVGRLVRLSVIAKVGPARYELRKAPVIAYFHELRRRLSSPR